MGGTEGVQSLKREYPDPRMLPTQPSWQQTRPQLTLSELTPGQYVSTTVRIAYVKTSERTDALGAKMVFTGVFEDSTFKAPFVSHRISYPLIRNSVYKFNSAYVHEFDDKSVLSIVTEHTDKIFLDGLVHGLLVNCVLPVREKHGFEAMAMYINNVDYYHPDKSNVLSPEKIAIAAKCAGIEPKIVFKNLFVQIAYSQLHQLAVAKHVSDFLESRNQELRLLIVNNITKYFREAKHKNYAAGILKETLGVLCKVCARNRIALICTGDANVTSKGIIPRPIGGTYLKHAVNVIVHFGEFVSYPQAFRITLLKHQYSKTPKSAVINARKTGRTLLLDGP